MRLLPLVALAAPLAACSSIELAARQGVPGDLLPLGTFAVARGTPGDLRTALEAELTAFGLREDRDSPALIARPRLSSEETMVVSPYAYGPGPRRDPESGVLFVPQKSISLELTIVAAEGGAALLRGRAETVEDGPVDGDLLRQMVRTILTD